MLQNKHCWAGEACQGVLGAIPGAEAKQVWGCSHQLMTPACEHERYMSVGGGGLESLGKHMHDCSRKKEDKSGTCAATASPALRPSRCKGRRDQQLMLWGGE